MTFYTNALFNSNDKEGNSNNPFYKLGLRLLSISSDYICGNIEEDKHWTKKLNSRILITYPYLAVTTLRYLLISACLSFPKFFAHYFTFDPMNDLLLRMGILDRHLALAISPAPLMFLYIDYLVSFTRGYSCSYQGHSLLVVNREDFWTLNPQLQNSLKKLLFSFLGNSTKGDFEDDFERVKLKWASLPHLSPHLEHRIRVRSVALTTAYDLGVAVIVLLVAALCPLALYACSFTSVWKTFSFLKKCLVTVDGTLALFLLWRSITITLFFGHATNSLFHHLLSRHQLSTFLSSTYLPFHRKLIEDTLTMDRQLVSRVLLFGLLSYFSFNIYTLTLFLFRQHLSTVERGFIFALFCLNPALVLHTLQTMISVHRAMHSPAKALHKALKLSTYVEVLTTGEKFAFSVGPIGKVTSSAVLEFTAVYIAYLLFSFNLIFKTS
ncbi:hypothetical protein TYRP_015115 [Tyrophagus putrescentiae]|nr:hypothetical protein TYRP_015115 [Tyrophagus putrescentiae]